MPELRNLFAALATLAPFAAHAIVATTSKTALNAVDGVWSYVGQMGGASAVAIDAHHVLTAGHVGGGDFLLGDSVYHAAWSALAPSVDLRIVAVTEALPGWYDVADSVKTGASVTMVGYGQSGVVNSAGTGYSLTSSGQRHAGTNKIASLQNTGGYGPTMRSGLTKAGDAVLGSGDSGGGWFVNGELVGISDYTFSTDTKKAAYGFAKSAYFGSGAIDLANANVRSWIDRELKLGIAAGPQPVPESSGIAAFGLGLGILVRKRKS